MSWEFLENPVLKVTRAHLDLLVLLVQGVIPDLRVIPERKVTLDLRVLEHLV